MSFAGKKVLVTGGMGFIGSHLTERLVRDGADVRVLGRYNSQGSLGWLDHSDTKGQFEAVLGDIRDPDCVRTACRGVHTIFHLAALIGIPYSYVAPSSYVDTNIQGTLNVLQAAQQMDAQRVVHTSTSEVYGTALKVPIDEAHPLQGQSPYSATKIAADKLAESFYRSFDLPVVTARPFNTFGPRQSMRAVIPTIINQALSGAQVRLGSLTPTRDFNYVTNTVEGFLAAATGANAVGKTYNLGFGEEISIGDLARLIFEIAGVEPRLQTEEERLRPDKSEVNRLLADSTLARRELGWTPAIGLREGLTRTLEWCRGETSERAGQYTV